jgi:hypothetical protein
MSVRHPYRRRRVLLTVDRLRPRFVDRWARLLGRDPAAGRELIAMEMAVT